MLQSTPFTPFVSFLILAGLASCTAPPLRTSNSVPQAVQRPQTATLTAAVQQTPERPKDYFTVGSSMDDVAAIMGTPSRVNNFLNDVWWYFGYSRVVFRGGRVTEWDNMSNNLKVRWNGSVAPAQARSAPVQSPQVASPSSSVSAPPPAAPIRRSLASNGGGLYIGTGSGHWIQNTSSGGEFITLEDGSVWQVDLLDRIDTLLWLPITDITVAESGGGYLLINTDDGEKAHATLLRQ